MTDQIKQPWPDLAARDLGGSVVFANDENVGFCRANNQAIRVSDAPLLLLVNTDARERFGALLATTAPRSSMISRAPDTIGAR